MNAGHQLTGRTNLIRAAYHCTRPPSYTTTGLTMYLATRYWTSEGQQGFRPLHHYSLVRPNNVPGLTVLYSVTADNLPGHTSISINGQTIYLATPLLQ